MKYYILLIFTVINFSCFAMDSTKEITEKIGSKIVINGTQYDTLRVLSVRNSLVKLEGKRYESALKLLVQFCKGDLIKGTSQISYGSDILVIVQKKKSIPVSNWNLDIEILSRKNLIKKTPSGCVVPVIVKDVIKSSVSIDKQGMVRIDEPTDVFVKFKKCYGYNWQDEIRTLIKK